MTVPAGFCPTPPGWELDWESIDAAFEWVRALEACAQSPEWHAEGNVWIHTRMVVEELTRLEAWRALPPSERELVFTACLMHDVGKPVTTRTEEDGRITARNHSPRGAVMARAILWRLGIPFDHREAICNLIRFHQLPFFLIQRRDADHHAIRISWTSRCDHLGLVAEADGRGRRCADRNELIEKVELYREHCRELGCFDAPRPFATDGHRVAYFRKPSRHPDASVSPDSRCEVTLMSGLPGSGKDHWIAKNRPELPVVSLDDLRAELGVDPRDNQGAVLQAARERARIHLRAGRDFCWNATNLSRDVRRRLLSLFADYGARTRIVYVETDPVEWLARNRSRSSPLPEKALERMLGRWQIPDRTEAHAVDCHVQTTP